MKIAVIGAGSTYTPELLDGLLDRLAALGIERVALHDIAPERLEPVAAFCRRLARRKGGEAAAGAGAIVHTTDLGQALDGARFVVVQLRVGGQAARSADIERCLRRGLVGQETTGMGGLAKALRTIPVIAGLALEIARRAPDAWVLNFTNPAGLITRAWLRLGHARALGLCNLPADLNAHCAAALDLPRERVRLDYAGLNHLSWARRVLVDDAGGGAAADRTAAAVERLAADPERCRRALGFAYPREFLAGLGAIPCGYLRYYYATAHEVARLRAAPRNRAEEVLEIERELFAWYADPARDEKPPALAKRGGAGYSRIAAGLVSALCDDRPVREIVNVENRGALPDLPDDAVVEIPVLLSRRGAEREPLRPLEPPLRALVEPVRAYEDLALAAGLALAEGDPAAARRLAIQAAVVHPLGPDAPEAPALIDEILSAAGPRP